MDAGPTGLSLNRIEGANARSWLLVPGDRPDQLSTSESDEADAMVLDLSDTVAPENKELARRSVTQHLCTGGSAWVQVNRPDSDLCRSDVRAIVRSSGLQGVILSRAESAEQVQAVKSQLRAGVMVIPLVQTAAGIENACALAAAQGTLRLAFGSRDLQDQLGIPGGAAALLYARSRLVMASSAAGLPGPIDGPSVDLDDIVGLGEDLRHSIGLGFTGKLCLHPQQLCMTNSAFAPTQSMLAWARRVLAATHTSPDSAVRVDSEIIDRWHIKAARYIVTQPARFHPAESAHGGPVGLPLRTRPPCDKCTSPPSGHL
jgi:citrate lyase subunit beta/citryl-CoA lyase